MNLLGNLKKKKKRHREKEKKTQSTINNKRVKKKGVKQFHRYSGWNVSAKKTLWTNSTQIWPSALSWQFQ